VCIVISASVEQHQSLEATNNPNVYIYWSLSTAHDMTCLQQLCILSGFVLALNY